MTEQQQAALTAHPQRPVGPGAPRATSPLSFCDAGEEDGTPWPHLTELLDLILLLHAHPVRPLQEVLGAFLRLLLQLALLALLQEALSLCCCLPLVHGLLRGQGES